MVKLSPYPIDPTPTLPTACVVSPINPVLRSKKQDLLISGLTPGTGREYGIKVSEPAAGVTPPGFPAYSIQLPPTGGAWRCLPQVIVNFCALGATVPHTHVHPFLNWSIYS